MIGPELATIGPAIVIVVVAAVSDWRSHRIPNELIVIGLVIALGIAAATNWPDSLTFSLSGAGVGFLLMLPGFMLRLTGAGDVKLLTMLGAFSGPTLILWVFVVTALSAASFVILRCLLRLHAADLMSHVRRYAAMFHTVFTTGQFVYMSPPSTSALSQRLPMAPFVAFALLATVVYRLVRS